MIAVVMTAIVLVNRLVIDDRGNTWGGLLMAAWCVGFGIVGLSRIARDRRSIKVSRRQDAS